MVSNKLPISKLAGGALSKKEGFADFEFGELVYFVNEYEKKPLEKGISKFVGLEDLPSASFSLKSFGDVEAGTTFSRVFMKGDVLFGKRRVYLRKVAIAEFSGVCSSDIFVFRANPTIIIPDLLPYIVISDSFIDHAISTSAGSLSPRTKWKLLKKYRLCLPQYHVQVQILNILSSLESCLEIVNRQMATITKLRFQMIDMFVSEIPSFSSLLSSETLVTVRFKDVVIKLTRKINPVSHGIERIVAGENLQTDDLQIRSWQTVGKDYLGPAFHVLFKPGDILYGSRRTYLKKVALADFEGVCANTTYVIRADEKYLLQDLLKHIMLSDKFTQYSIGVSKGSTNPYINWKDLHDFTFQLPNLATQRIIADTLDKIMVIAETYRSLGETLNSLKHKLLNEILG